VKIVIIAGDSTSAQKQIESIFTVTVAHKCLFNAFTISDTTAKSYEIAATGTATAVPVDDSVVSGATADCAIKFSVEIMDSSTSSWTQVTAANIASTYTFISSAPAADLSSNAFSIQTTDFATWAGRTISMRMRVWAPDSKMTGAN
jgi:hypothetical protein